MAQKIEDEISEFANLLLRAKSRIKLLEAGCGSASWIKLDKTVDSVGIDISSEQLAKNTAVREKILGDIQTYPLPPAAFDVVVCWMVMEHLPRPNDAIINMLRTLRPGGLLILGFPHLLSFKGIVTKETPLWFHRLFYRMMKYQSQPFPTYLRTDILPGKLSRFAEQNDCSVVFCRLDEGNQTRLLRNRFWPIDLVLSIASEAMRLITFGKVQLLLDNCYMILRKSQTSSENSNICSSSRVSTAG